MVASAMLVFGGCSTPYCPDVLVRAPHRNDRTDQVALPEAITIADQVATEELRRAEVEGRSRDTNVVFRLSDYRVSVSEKPTAYRFFFQHNNPNVPFELWDGHPMHFTIYVDKKSGRTKIIGGM